MKIPGLSIINSFLHPERGYKKAQEQLDHYYDQSQQFYKPYVEQGQQAYGHLGAAMENLLNPSSFYDEMLSSYQPSEAARLAKTSAMGSGLDAASSMGLMGSEPALRSIQAGTHGIMANDQMNYIKNLMDQYFKGADLAQNIYGTGANAGQGMGQNAMNMGQNSAQMAFGQQNAPGQMLNDLLKSAAFFYKGGIGGGMPIGSSNKWSTTGGKV